jgi:uncharacterized phage-associated protein
MELINKIKKRPKLMVTTFPFKNEKTTQALNFFAIKTGGTINKLHALKLIYLADRYHIRIHGRPITGDTYYAMRLGPMASNAKNFAENKIHQAQFRDYNNKYIETIDKTKYRSIQTLDKETLSEYEIEALEWTWTTFRQLTQNKLVDYTHRYPEWKKHENKIITPQTRIPMDYLDFLEDPKTPRTELCHMLIPESKKRLQINIKKYQEILATLS